MNTLPYSVLVYIAVMAGVTYIIRMVPFTFFRKKIKSRFVRSFLNYIPYAVLSAMTMPAIFYSTGDIRTAVAGTVVALVLAFFRLPLIVVALAAAGAAFASGWIFELIASAPAGEITTVISAVLGM